jgi:hypothetical protein
MEQPSAMGIPADQPLGSDRRRKIPYLDFKGGEILRPGDFFRNPGWRGGAGGRRTFCQPGFWRRLTGWAMTNLYKETISTLKAAGSRRATVLLPLSQPPASPGLMRRTPSRRSARELWVCPNMMTS